MMDGREKGSVEDGELIRYLDGELQGAARASLEARVSQAPALAARLERLAARSQNLTRVLASLDPSPSSERESYTAIRPQVARGSSTGARRRVAPRWMRGAAAVAAVLALALIVPPARAWMTQRARALAEAVGLLAPADPAVSPPSAPEGAAHAGPDFSSDFAASGETFDIEIAAPAGTLIVRGGEGSGGKAEVTSPATSTLVVFTSGIRIDGAPSEETVYDITLPAGVRQLRIRRGGGPLEAHPMPAGGEELRLRLSEP